MSIQGEQLLAALRSVGNEDVNIRNASEQFIQEAMETKGCMLALFQVLNNQDVDKDTRQMAAIMFKQLVNREWAEEFYVGPANSALEAEQTYSVIREHILMALVNSPPPVAAQLKVCLRVILRADFPAKWPTFPQALMALFQSNDPPQIKAALSAVRIAGKVYEYLRMDSEKKEALKLGIIDPLFPMLLQLFQYLSTLSDENSLLLQNDVVKIFYRCVLHDAPVSLADPNVFLQWMTLFIGILTNLNVPAGQPEEETDRQRWPWWRIKTTIMQAVNRLYRVNDDILRRAKKLKKKKKTIPNPAKVAFATQFQNVYAGKYLEASLYLLSQISSGGYLTRNLLYELFSFTNRAAGQASTFAIMQPHLPAFMNGVVFRVVCLNESDREEWVDNPVEYLKTEIDNIGLYSLARTKAVEFACDLLSKRSKKYLVDFMNHLVQILGKYQADPTNLELAVQKEAALNFIGSLNSKLAASTEFKSALPQMLQMHVLPELKSPFGFLRSRAVWCIGRFLDHRMVGDAYTIFSDELVLECAQHVITLFQDEELVVRVFGSLALPVFLDYECVMDKIRPGLPHVLDQYLKLMNELDFENVVSAMKLVVDQFTDDMGPYAIRLCQGLTQRYLCLLDEVDDDSAFTALEVLSTMSSILSSTDDQPEVFYGVAHILLPAIEKTLSEDYMEFLDNVLMMLSHITQKIANPFSAEVWAIFPKLFECYHLFASDFIECILGPLDNYISRGNVLFLSDERHLQSVCRVFSELMSDEEALDVNVMAAIELVIVVLQYCPGSVDGIIEPVLQLALPVLQRALAKENDTRNASERKQFATKAFTELNLQLLCNCLIYNSNLTVSILNKFNALDFFLTNLLDSGLKYPRLHEKKICSLALSSILSCDMATMPQPLQTRMPLVVQQQLLLLKLLETERAEDEEEDDEDEEEEEEDDEEEPDDPGAEDHEDVATGGYDFHDILNNNLEQFLMMDEDDEGVQFDVTTPFDDVNEVIVFFEKSSALATTQPQAYQQLMAALVPEYQTLFQEFMQKAQQQQVAQQLEQAQAAQQQQLQQ
eukprot:TRINITY_DN1226_c0_g4_i1.p1 TRINITY_DN1226_c0_g4~~TRINITY_DN1226_c0_g4_i1.p1  ORF type:complete len:1052 (+),score=354.49 TRINITY_DN1226_c0_g4_i1:169-3324(+)